MATHKGGAAAEHSIRWLKAPHGLTRGDMLAGVTVALVLIPQSIAYATIAGVDPVYGLYAAAAAPLAGALVGSSPYLQTGPVAVTSLLTFGALSAVAEPYTARFALLAAMLAILVGLIRLLIGIIRGGFVAYFMSQPVVASFITAAALLIIGSQVPSMFGVRTEVTNPIGATFTTISAPADWSPVDLLLSCVTLVIVIASRIVWPMFPGALVAVVGSTAWSAFAEYDGRTVGDISLDFSPPNGFALSDLEILLLPALLIALIGFAEPAAIARRYAMEDRQSWNPDRELIGQGLANVAAGAVGGIPVGGSFSRTALNRWCGARSRWSGAVTGLAVVAAFPTLSLLSSLPTAVLAGIIVAAVSSLIDLRMPTRYWHWSRPQFMVAVVTVSATLFFAPRVERGLLLGMGTALIVHLWRELRVDVPFTFEFPTLHLWPTGVLYFGSAAGFERIINRRVADHSELRRLVIHVDRLGRVDITGAIMLREVVKDAHAAELCVSVCGANSHTELMLRRVLEGIAVNVGSCDRDLDSGLR